MKISARLSLLIGAMVLGMAVIGGHAATALHDAQLRSATNLERASAMLKAVDEARTAEVHFRMQIQEFKNVLLRGHDAKDHQRYFDGFRKRAESVGEHLAAAKAAVSRLGLPTDDIDGLAQLHRGITQQYTDSLKLFEIGRTETSALVDASVRGKDRPMEAKMESVITGLEQYAHTEEERVRQLAASEIGRASCRERV